MSRSLRCFRLFAPIFLVCMTFVCTAGVSSLGLPPALADGPSDLAGMASVPGRSVPVVKPPPDPAAAAAKHPVRPVVWPAAGRTAVTIPAAKTPVRAGGLPVWIAPAAKGDAPGKVAVSLLDRQAVQRTGRLGVALQLNRADGKPRPGRVRLTLDYGGFRTAAGGDFGARLKLYRVPACLLEVRPSCRNEGLTEVAADNQAGHSRLVADVGVSASGPVTYLAAAAADGPTGAFSATQLSPTAKWEVGLQSGDFTWSYPLKLPDMPGVEPQLALQYSSASVDGKTSSANNQPSWVGEGFELSPGFIERSYRECDEDSGGNAGIFDKCWVSDNATVSFPGLSGALVRDDATGTWKAERDSGWRVERLTSSSNGNGDNDGEHWKLTSPDGTQYFFGLNRLPGWASGKPETQSVWTEPVFANHAGEPCRASSAANSWCQQGYRWNLDYIVDRYGDVVSYYYQKETNIYGRWNGGEFIGTETPYVRGGTLARIEYGQRNGSVYSTTAPARVMFNVADRCTSSSSSACNPSDTANWKNWPDVPWDQQCTSVCWLQAGLGYWSTKRLASVSAQVYSGGAYANVTSWSLRQSYPDPYPAGDPYPSDPEPDAGDASKSLWLNGITQTGQASGTSASLPEVTFSGVSLQNRVEPDGSNPSHYKWRVGAINNETGGRTEVTYSARSCDGLALISPSSNTDRCYPMGEAGFHANIFHKYVATQVVERDLVGGNPAKVTSYEYVGGGAWRYDDSDATPNSERSWNQWRGFEKVNVYTGTGSGRAKSQFLFHRGMNGDLLGSGGHRSVTVTDSQGVAYPDHRWLQGFQREQTTYNGEGGGAVQIAANEPVWSAATATRSRSALGLDSAVARQVDVGVERERVPLSDGTTRTAEKRHSYDAYDQLERTNDLGDLSTPADDACLRISYARNTTAWILNAKSRQELVSVGCDTAPTYPADLISGVRTFFDGSGTWGASPTPANVTRVEEVTSYQAGQPVYGLVGQATYDNHGRMVRKTDAAGNITTTTFTPATGGPATQVVTANALGHTETTTLHPLLGLPTSVVQPDGERTDFEYDAFGRLLRGYKYGRASSRTLTAEFGYTLRTNGPSYLTQRLLRGDGSYATSYTLLDGQLRTRQTQLPGPNGGRVVADVFYDDRGLEAKTNTAYYNSSLPSTSLLAVADSAVPSQTTYTYDGAGRPTVEALLSKGVEKWRTTTAYGGNWVSVDPPAGGTATTTFFDVRGQRTELREFTGDRPSGDYSATRYSYTKAAKLASVTDAAGNVWRYSYDDLGRLIRKEDPDAGVTTTAYNDLDLPVSTTDGRGQTLAYTYDAVGRRTGMFAGSTAGTKLADWTYDTLAEGQPTASTRYVDGAAYSSQVLGYDDAGRPTGHVLTIPSREGALAGSYRTDYTYNVADQVTSVRLPYQQGQTTVGGLPDETVTTGYGANGLPTTLTGLTTYVASSAYTNLGDSQQHVLGSPGAQVWQTHSYDEATRRLTRSLTERQASTLPVVSDVSYGYDPAGNVTRIADTAAGRTPDVQCFGYDNLRRLTEAWTPSSGACDAAPTVNGLGGAAPYWQSFTYDSVGNRLTDVWHAAAGDTTKRYTYPSAGAAHPHAVSSVAVSGPDGERTDTYTYDASGNRLGSSGAEQTLTWDAEGKLASASNGTSYLYDADGARLLRKDASGTTLYLGGSTELRMSGGQVRGTRYYYLNDEVVAVRTGSALGDLSWLTSDHHNTATVAINAATLEPAYRRSLPFGGPRGPQPSWPSERGFVGGTTDPTGLTHLGAREYDSRTGAFVSVDPVIDPGKPQEMQGYSYSAGNPVTFTDPDGLKKKSKEELEAEARRAKIQFQQQVKDAQARIQKILNDLSKQLTRMERSGATAKEATKAMLEAAAKIDKVLGDVKNALNATNYALAKAGMREVDYVVFEAGYVRSIHKDGFVLDVNLAEVSPGVAIVSQTSKARCGCGTAQTKENKAALANIRAKLRTAFKGKVPSSAKLGLGIQLTLTRTGRLFYAPVGIAASSDGPYAAVRAGQINTGSKHIPTDEEVDGFIAGWFISAGTTTGHVSVGAAQSLTSTWNGTELGVGHPPGNWAYSVSLSYAICLWNCS